MIADSTAYVTVYDATVPCLPNLAVLKPAAIIFLAGALLVALPLDVSLRGLALAANSIVGYGMVPYRLVGDITADTPIGSRRIPFDQKGEFAPVKIR